MCLQIRERPKEIREERGREMRDISNNNNW